MPREFVWAISPLGANPDADVVCSYCQATIKVHEATLDTQRRIICLACRETRERACSDCGTVRPVEQLRAYPRPDGGTIHLCTHCRENYFTCQRCHQPVHKIRDGHHRSHANGHVCAECWTKIPRIYSYNHKPEPEFFGCDGETPRRRGFGVEVEMDGGNVDAFFRQHVDYPEVYYKHDGSLSSDGIELVTHPATLRYHMEKMPWEAIFAAAKKAGYSTARRTHIGTHVHMSRRMFGSVHDERNANVLKFMLLVDRFWPQFLTIACRSGTPVESYAKRAGATKDDKPLDTENLDPVTDRIKRHAGGDRHVAVNTQPQQTVEFRVFKGTLDKNMIVAIIQMCDHMITFCKTVSFDVVATVSWEDFIAGVKHTELEHFLKTKRLLK